MAATTDLFEMSLPSPTMSAPVGFIALSSRAFVIVTGNCNALRALQSRRRLRISFLGADEHQRHQRVLGR
jgi:hypothetical protein